MKEIKVIETNGNYLHGTLLCISPKRVLGVGRTEYGASKDSKFLSDFDKFLNDNKADFEMTDIEELLVSQIDGETRWVKRSCYISKGNSKRLYPLIPDCINKRLYLQIPEPNAEAPSLYEENIKLREALGKMLQEFPQRDVQLTEREQKMVDNCMVIYVNALKQTEK